MKTFPKTKSLATSAAILSALFLLTSWSPPDLNVQIGSQTHASNYRGYVGGYTNTLSTSTLQTGFGTVLGNNNTAFLSAAVVAGGSNTIANGSTTSAHFLSGSGVFGSNNTIPQSRNNLLVAGTSHTVNATHSFVSGNSNTLNGVPVGDASYCSAAIGQSNNVASTTGWAVGYQNNSSGTRSLSLGSGSNASQTDSTAIGRYNATMTSGDVFVVGTGTSSVPNTSLKATSDGSVVLGSATSGKVVLAKAQGDISMGQYTN